MRDFGALRCSKVLFLLTPHILSTDKSTPWDTSNFSEHSREQAPERLDFPEQPWSTSQSTASPFSSPVTGGRDCNNRWFVQWILPPCNLRKRKRLSLGTTRTHKSFLQDKYLKSFCKCMFVDRGGLSVLFCSVCLWGGSALWHRVLPSRKKRAPMLCAYWAKMAPTSPTWSYRDQHPANECSKKSRSFQVLTWTITFLHTHVHLKRVFSAPGIISTSLSRSRHCFPCKFALRGGPNWSFVWSWVQDPIFRCPFKMSPFTASWVDILQLRAKNGRRIFYQCWCWGVGVVGGTGKSQCW